MLKTMLKLLKYLSCLLLFILVLVFLYHQYSLNKEKKFLTSSIGQRVEVDGKQMNVYVAGNGPKTLVFLSGSGTSSPILDFKSLYSKLVKDYRVVVVEKFGYGFSDDWSKDRDLDTILSQTRKALQEADVKGPYVLLPHSMSGLEAIHWSASYPKEVEAIIGLDMSFPQAYDKYRPNRLLYKTLQLVANLGLSRWLYSPDKEIRSLSNGSLNPKEKSIYKALFYRRPLSNAIMKEAEEVKSNAKLVKQDKVPAIPYLLFVSNGQGTGFARKGWQDMSKDFAKDHKNVQLKIFDVPHYIHSYIPDELAKKIRKFLK